MLPINVTLTLLEPEYIGGPVAIDITGIDPTAKQVVTFRCVANDPDRTFQTRNATDVEVALALVLQAAAEQTGLYA